MLDKATRMQDLAAYIAENIGADATLAARAAWLAKADLVTAMVKEFPETQGIMGGHYAKISGEDAKIAHAITRHYAPMGPQDTCPTDLIGVAVALADKIDTLVGFWTIGEKPTGSKDPFALRRAALGVIRIITENQLHLNLTATLNKAADLYQRTLPSDLHDFILERFRILMTDIPQVSPMILQAVANTKALQDLALAHRKAIDLSTSFATPDGAAFISIMKRIANILQSDAASPSTAPIVNQGLFHTAAEKQLWQHITLIEADFIQHCQSEKNQAAIQIFAKLHDDVMAFFDQVVVMDPDAALRQNRISLLKYLNHLSGQLIKLSF
jgi:glycyl-tRNA synthetase beta chain